MPERDDRLDPLVLDDGVEPAVAIVGDRRVVDVALAAALAEHRVEVGVDEDVAAVDAEAGEQALDPLSGFAHEDPPGDRLVGRRVLAEHEHPRRAVEPAAMEAPGPTRRRNESIGYTLSSG